MTFQGRGRWLAAPPGRPAAQLRLFCLPYAGGAASVFRGWQQKFPASIDVLPVQLPGREWRLHEPAGQDMQTLAEMTVNGILPWLDRPFALLGVSMGGLLLFEMARHLRRTAGPAPVCLLPLACGAPHIPEPDPIHDLPDTGLVAAIKAFGGLPEAIADHPELAELFLPIIRADCVTHEKYRYVDDVPLPTPIAAYGGIDDDTISRDRLEAWMRHTSSGFQLRMIPGSHLFVNEMPPILIESLSRTVLACTAGVGLATARQDING